MAYEVYKRRAEEKKTRMMKYIRWYFMYHGYAPSYNEIGESMGFKSQSSVWFYMQQLFEEGRLESDLKDRWSTPRAFRVARTK